MVDLTTNLFYNENIEKYGGFQHSPSFLEQISFISNPNFNNTNLDQMNGGNNNADVVSEIVGGFPIVSNNNNNFDNNSLIGLLSQTGGKAIEGLSNLKHLYVPPGLVIYSYKSKCREPDEPIYNKPIETISDDKFDNLFNQLIKSNNLKKSKNNKTKIKKLEKINTKTKSNTKKLKV
jgi:hypothetical protein